jgi:hypothetical protein
MLKSKEYQNAESVFLKIHFLTEQLNDELSTCHIDGLIIFPKIKTLGFRKSIELSYINYLDEDNLSYRELFRGKLYSMILIRLKTRFLNFYRSNGEPLLLSPVYKIGKYIYLFLMRLALNFSSVLTVDKYYIDKTNIWNP